MPTRWSRTTSRMPRPRWARPGPPSSTASRGTSRRPSHRPSWPTWWPTSRGRLRAARRCGASSPGGRRRCPPSWRRSASRRCWRRSAATEGPRHLGEDFELVRETFHRFAEEKVRPHAEHVHRTNADIPEDVIEGLAELGGFGLSVPEEYGGYASGGESDYMGMVVATEELSWGSLGVGGSLITRPEILDAGARLRRHRGAEEALAAEAGVGRDPGRGGRDGARLRVGRGGDRDVGDAGRRRVGRERRQDVVHVRGPCRRADAAGADGPGPVARASRDLHVRGREAAGGRPRLRVHAGCRRRGGPARWVGAGAAGGPADRHTRVPGHALLRAGVRELVRAGGEPGGWRGGAREGLLSADAGLRERAPADGSPCAGRDAGRLRGRGRRTRRSARCSARRSSTTS